MVLQAKAPIFVRRKRHSPTMERTRIFACERPGTHRCRTPWRTLLAALVCCLAGGPLAAQPYLYDAKAIRLYERDFVDTIPLTIVEGRLYVPVRTGGEEYLFLLDTGNGLGEIHAEGHLRPQKRLGEKTFFDFNGTTQTLPVVAMPPFRLGHIEVGNFPVSLTQRPLPQGYEGVLGFVLFQRGVAAKIDLRRRQLILTDRKKFFRDEEGHRLKYRLYGFTPQVELSPFEGYTAEAVFDTGNPHLFLLDKRLLEEWEDDPKVARQVTEWRQGQELRSAYSLEPHGEMADLRLDRLAWGRLHLRGAKGRTKQGMSNLGAAFLRYGSIIIDPWRKELVFQPYKK